MCRSNTILSAHTEKIEGTLMTSRITFPLTLSGMIETLKTINLRYDDRILFSGFDGNPKIESRNE